MVLGKRPIDSPHIKVTEAQSLDEAIAILEKQQRIRRQSETCKKNYQENGPTLGQVFAQAKFCAATRIGRTKRWPKDRIKTPHPFHDLDDSAKRAKCVEMFKTGQWGTKIRAQKLLARVFKVPVGAVAIWLDSCDEVL